MAELENQAPQIWLVDDALIYAPTSAPVFADVNPEDPEGTPQIPFNGRLTQPPAVQTHQAARSLGHLPTDGWEIVDDYRGFTYWTADRQLVTIDQIGVKPPEGYLANDPGPSDAEDWQDFLNRVRATLASSGQTVEQIVEWVSLGKLPSLQAPEVVAFFQWRVALRGLVQLEMPAKKTDWPEIPPAPGFPSIT